MNTYTEEELENLAKMFKEKHTRDVALEIVKQLSFKDFIYFNYYLMTELKLYSFYFDQKLAFDMLKYDLNQESEKLNND